MRFAVFFMKSNYDVLGPKSLAHDNKKRDKSEKKTGVEAHASELAEGQIAFSFIATFRTHTSIICTCTIACHEHVSALNVGGHAVACIFHSPGCLF